ncbi:siderophore-interacting protein [Pedococcus sp. NPDC057267]|uniref:siderophore-interacting protein n=1 Tax=Pedococcus sp. NPDC057267 TaxID=3346077 RepID=UPI00363296AB
MTAATVSATVPSVLIAAVTVEEVERVSPAFVRVVLGGDSLADLGTADGFDTRFKIVLPGPTGLLPDLGDGPGAWRQSWSSMPDSVRSPMRTYTIRDVRTRDGAVQLVTDFVVHDGEPDTLGPACRWALAAKVGDVVHVVAPHRLAPIYGGTEFNPGHLRDLLLVGDETAVPAVARILADVGPGFTGHAFLEVPSSADALELEAPDGLTVTWLPRGDASHGRRLVAAVRDHLGLPPTNLRLPLPPVPSDLDVDVWETPRYSSAGEDLTRPAPEGAGRDLAGTYTWIAGEAWCVRILRRTLVSDLDVERSRVAFMGYWREGVAMRT